jgi:formylmethanofuran dehydrogenase subunit A
VNSDVEMEAGAGVVPYSFKKNNPANAIQWAIGLELALNIYDPWRVYMTTDHPNGGPFVFYPQVISWLMSRKARTDTMLGINKAVMRRTTLANVYREYTFEEIATVTRAATARVLGLENKGHLGPGADGDVSVYHLDPTAWRPSMYTDLEKAFIKAAYTIKAGNIVVKDGEVMATPLGTTFWADARVPEDVEAEFMKDLEEEFSKHYTVGLKNYPVEDAYLPTQKAIRAGGD